MAFKDFSRRMALTAVAATALGLLSACTETAGEFNANADPRIKVPGIPVAFVSLQGAPETATSRLSSAIAQQAARRDIIIVGVDGKPRYQMRGYVSAQPGANGATELAWVFDIYDAQRKRAQRISGQEPVRASGDVWSSLTEQDMQRVAFRSVDEIAAFLAGTPEAVAIRTAPSIAPSAASRAATGVVATGAVAAE
jgi:hypothetical protein